MYKNVYNFIVVDKSDLINLGLGMESVVRDIKYLRESHPEDSFIPQTLHSVHEVFTDMLVTIAKNRAIVGFEQDSTVAESETFERIIKEGRERFNDMITSELDHWEDAWTYNLDRPIAYGIIRRSDWEQLIEGQKKVLNTPLKDLLKAGTPEGERAILDLLENGLPYKEVKEISPHSCVHEDVILFWMTEEEEILD